MTLTKTLTKRLMTVDDLLSAPDDGYRYELIRGKLVKRMSAGFEHGTCSSRININMGAYVQAHGLGETLVAETTFLLATDPDHARIPDVAFVSAERLHLIEDRARAFPAAPDLAVEVISPTDRLTLVREKVADWLAHGVRMVIVVNPRNRAVEVHRPQRAMVTLTESDTIDGGDVLPGWRMRVADVFA